MVDLTTILAIAAITAGIMGAFGGAYLGAWLAYHFGRKERTEENKQQVIGLRKILYEDIVTIYIALNELLTVIKNDLATSKLSDIDTISVALQQYQHGLLDLQKTDWYTNARAYPFIFLQLSDKERKAIAQIAGLQGTVVAVSGDKYILLQQRVKEGEIEPRQLIEALKDDLEKNIIGFVRQLLKAGLDKELLLEVCPDENKHYISSIFDDESGQASDEQEKLKKQKKRRLLQRIRS
jgi:hypothetical protein